MNCVTKYKYLRDLISRPEVLIHVSQSIFLFPFAATEKSGQMFKPAWLIIEPINSAQFEKTEAKKK